MSDDEPRWAAPGGAPPPAEPGRPAEPGPPPLPPTRLPTYGSGPTQPMYAAYRPGIVPLRPLDLGDVFGGATLAIRGNPAATLGLGVLSTLAFVVPATALGALVTTTLLDQLRIEGTTQEDIADLAGRIGALLPSFGLVAARFLMSAFTAHVVGQGVLGRKVTLQQTWEAARGRLWRVVGSALLILAMLTAAVLVLIGLPVVVIVAGASGNGDGLAAVGVLLLVAGFLATVAAALFIGTRFAFAASAIVLEDLGVRAGLGRSWRLTAGGAFWRVLGIRLLVGVLVGVVSAILALPIGLVLGLVVGASGMSAATFAVASVLIQAVAVVVSGALTTPFSAGTDTLLYVDQRIRREGLDVQLVAAVQGGR